MKTLHLLVILCSLTLLLALTGCMFDVESEGTPNATATFGIALTRAVAAILTSSSTANGLEGTATATAPPPAAVPSSTPTVTVLQPNTPTSTVCGPPTAWVAYTVLPGDTLFSLGRRTGASVEEIQAANCLSNTIIYIGQPLYVPSSPVPTAIPTQAAAPPPTVPLPTIDPSAIWAPNGERYATHLGTVVDVQRGLVIEAARIPWVKFWNWTPDSRYAIFGRRNQYGDASTHVFDAQDWKLVHSTPYCPRSPCGEFPLLLSPLATRLVTENGILIDFTGTPQTNLVVGSEFLKLKIVKWSDDGAYLAYVSYLPYIPGYNQGGSPDYTLYAVRGDGTQVLGATPIDSEPQTLRWLSLTTAQLMTTTRSYTLDVTTGQLQVASIQAPTIAP